MTAGGVARVEEEVGGVSGVASRRVMVLSGRETVVVVP